MTDAGFPADPSPPASPIEVVLVGAGNRARAWLDPLLRSLRLTLVATVGRGETIAPGLPHHRSLGEAMRAHPEAAFAVALPPRSGLEAALALAEAGRAGVVEAPLHDELLAANLGSAATRVRVAHGWVTLPGVTSIRKTMRQIGGGRIWIEASGLPEEDGGDLAEVLVHAVALLGALLPDPVPMRVRHGEDGCLEIDFATRSEAAWSASLRPLTRGRRLSVELERRGDSARWTWDADRETVTHGAKRLVGPRPTPPAAVRALAQLLPDTPQGDSLVEARAAIALARSCLDLLPARLPLGERSFRQSASIGRRRPSDLLDRLGLRGSLPADGPMQVSHSASAARMPTEPFELWAFRAGVKPVAFLTLRPGAVEPIVAAFGRVHVERRERRVRVEAQDRWTDRRDEGEPRVELYIARDPELARRAATLQAQGDPSQGLRELGALLGYPPCCVEAFASQDDRANNSRNRYFSRARTFAPRTPNAASGEPADVWPWELNNLDTMIAPFYPCSYRCSQALAWVRRTLGEVVRADRVLVDELRDRLGRPVLYFDHDHQLVFDGDASGERISFRAVAPSSAATPDLAPLAAAIGRGDRLTFDRRRLVVERGTEVVLDLERTDPGLGFVAPFGVASRESL